MQELIDFVTFKERKDRSRYIANRFESYLGGSVLDVGCYMKDLNKFIDAERYVGIDIAGDPDEVIDLDQVDKLPFADGEFDTVVCSDVLEHLENIHLMFDELVRIAKNNIIVSLPNCWNALRKPIERGYGEAAHYGLPIEKPSDRHRWFFSYSQAKNFMIHKGESNNLEIVFFLINYKKRLSIVNFMRKIINLTPDRYNNRFSHTVWVCCKK